ncbi:hypothetical protein [Streptomyces sp. Je 1-332]|uniref:hypothetical protein n=1 Tax=Streptomyces sp. Je 1-332 TaxID=3231270 RepID=UPI003459A452
MWAGLGWSGRRARLLGWKRSLAEPLSVTVQRFTPYADLTSFATAKEKTARAVKLGRGLHARF